MIKDFNVMTLDTPISVISVEKIDDERIKATTIYKIGGDKPYVETMPIESNTFTKWYKMNENNLVIR